MTQSGDRALGNPTNPPFAGYALHILTLSVLVVAQPLLDTVARNGEFLVAHRATRTDLIGLVLVLIVGVPAAPILVGWICGFASRRLQTLVVALTIFTLFGLQAVPILKRAGMVAAWPTLGSATSLAAVVTLLYWRTSAIRFFVSLLGLGVLVVPAVFLSNESIARVWRSSNLVAPPAPQGVSTPIVMVVLDQMPLVSLLDDRGEIDRRLFPSFAALAGESTWFRGATAVADRTGAALPAMLTGEYPPGNRLPRVEDYPNNLFTWLSPYEFHVYEPITALCPPRRCGQSLSSAMERLESMLGDLTVVFQHIVSPVEIETTLPPINQDWRDFDTPLWRRLWRQRRVEDRRATFVRFVNEIESKAERPVLHFLHVLLPHEPFIYYPSGLRFAMPREPLSGLTPVTERWSSDRWLVAYSYQRHLQQVRMVDGLLGALTKRLKEVGLYDAALLVIVSDHGASFRPGESFRTPDSDNVADIMSVPLLVKAPYQREGRVDDAPVETVDVLPTIANLLKVKVPWVLDGGSAFAPPDRRRQRIYYGGTARRSISTAGVLRGREEALRLKLEWFGSPPDPDRLTGLGAAARVLGKRADAFPRLAPQARFVLLEPRSKVILLSDGEFLPGIISGRVPAERARRGAPELAVAVDGTIEAVARPAANPIGRTARWAALIPEQAQRHAQQIEIFEVVDAGGDRVELRTTGAVAERSR